MKSTLLPFSSRLWRSLFAPFASVLILPLSTAAVEPEPGATAAHDGRHDFDFLLGQWHIVNRRLVARLAGCSEWETFEARQKAWPILDGLGNQDEFRADAWRPGFIGMTLRLFNPATKQWSIYWVDNQRVVLDPPVVGAWADDRGIFTTRDVFNGKPIIVRFTWTRFGRTPHAGNRSSPPTRARRGRKTGSWTSLAPPTEAARIPPAVAAELSAELCGRRLVSFRKSTNVPAPPP